MPLEKGAYQSNLIIKKCNRPFSVGMCVGWDMPEIYKDLDIDIIGTLYTKNGAKLVLRNLLANPEFRILIILDTNQLGHNNIGKHGLDLLHKIFFCHQENLVSYNVYELINKSIIYYVRPNEMFVNYGNSIDTMTLDTTDIMHVLRGILNEIKTLKFDDIIRNPVIYEPDEIKMSKYVPNEYLGVSIRGISLFDAWYQTLNHVYKYGHTNAQGMHEYHSVHWNFPIDNMKESLESARKIITQEDVRQMISIDQQSLEDYSKTMNENIIIDSSSYTYGSRLHMYKERMCDYIKKDVRTRYAFGTTLRYDIIDKQAPCMIFVQLLYDNANNVLNLYAIFRSHDIFKAALANGYALNKMLREYCEIGNANPGRVEITSISAHVYEVDMNNAKLFVSCISENIKDVIRYDARGNFIITKDNGYVTCELREPKENMLICTLSGTPYDVYKKILDEQIITETEHLSYIFQQLFMPK